MKWSESATMAVEPYLSLVATIFQSTQLSGSIPQPPSHILRRLRIIRFVRWRNIACKWRNTMLYSYIPILSQFFADWCDIWDKTCRFVPKFWAIFSSCIHDGLIPPITRDPKAMVWANHWVLVYGFGVLGWGFAQVVLFFQHFPMCSSPFFGCFGALPNMLKASLQIPMAQWIPHSPGGFTNGKVRNHRRKAVLCSTSHHEN